MCKDCRKFDANTMVFVEDQHDEEPTGGVLYYLMAALFVGAIFLLVALS